MKSSRVAIPKRLRFEVLRRDNHTCRYCGRAAPDVKLHIDHVVPVILGGGDEPANLVTACSDCNGGKTSSAPDQTTVAEVDATAVKWAAAMARAAEESRQVSDGRLDTYEGVLNAFPSYYRHDRIPGDFRDTVNQFLDAGLPADVVVEMAHVAATKYGVTQRWNYFCGCCWTKLRQLQDRAKELVEGPSDGSLSPQILETVWTANDVDVYIGRCEDFARNVELHQESIDSTNCPHREWGQGSCPDPICRLKRAESLSWMAYQQCREDDKAEAVMDAADELELAH